MVRLLHLWITEGFVFPTGLSSDCCRCSTSLDSSGMGLVLRKILGCPWLSSCKDFAITVRTLFEELNLGFFRLLMLNWVHRWSLQVHLYGTSLGGFLAQMFAQHRPRRVKSLLLSNTFVDNHTFQASMSWSAL